MSTIRGNHPSHTSQSQSSQRNQNDQRVGNDRREAPPREEVDRFRALMQPPREGRTGQRDEEYGRYGLADDSGHETHLPAQPETAEAPPPQDNGTQEFAGLKAFDEKKGTHSDERFDSDRMPTAEASAMWQAQLAMRADAAPVSVPTPVNTGAFAEMIERHVRLMAVSDGGARDHEGQVFMRLSDATLPGTDLLLTKTADGWQLRADVRSRSSYDALNAAAPALARRFAERNLGPLSIEPFLHD